MPIFKASKPNTQGLAGRSVTPFSGCPHPSMTNRLHSQLALGVPRATWHQHSRPDFLPNSKWVLQPSPPTANSEDKAKKKKREEKGLESKTLAQPHPMAMSISVGCVRGDSGTVLAPSASSLRPPLRRAAGPKVWTPAPRPLNPSIYLV